MPTSRSSNLVAAHLQDIYDHLVRVVESVEDYQDLCSAALDANLTVVSNKVAEVARALGAMPPSSR